jgi:hypothetical protein|tara:strand:- start:2450 stop:2821 length:372 start_codon:yes stop_codon:yes gene_type:complete
MFIRLLLVLLIVVGIPIINADVSAAPKFVPGINDLPLMPGLTLKSETPVVFDTPGGRIVEVFAIGKVPLTRIRSFYGETLPQLGWQPKNINAFQRDNETLKIEISEDGNGRRVIRFSVVPHRK